MKKITDTTPFIGPITTLVMDYLERFKDNDEPSLYASLYVSTDPQNGGLDITYQENPYLGQPQKVISEQEAKELIKDKITEIFLAKERIILIADRDNCLVGITSLERAGNYNKEEIENLIGFCYAITAINGRTLTKYPLYIFND